ncbi:uncharacterized protein PFL1_02184 [Pseudozyma flocculosa PF-1]|uniref:Related to allantoate permease n=1 Tax=Pseudozyma flocculosa TaxID=84751 RepID=A0A5C3FAZ2_9BASI|nr:uncharacterized protein PFL1_02184 [Pseudozyma flocculosa PF-1]EPQ30067.1 hypothetical protein PFL1_02184 [Pseudozyma flocculosa PF-1]SPO41410.1 related to allantoate permease [Pseudozyma flocculosa]
MTQHADVEKAAEPLDPSSRPGSPTKEEKTSPSTELELETRDAMIAPAPSTAAKGGLAAGADGQASNVLTSSDIINNNDDDDGDDEQAAGPRPWYRRFWQSEVPRSFYREALARYGGEGGLDAADDARIRRRLDLIILPLIAVCYAWYYIDKTTLSYAAIFGLKADLALTGDMYAWLSSCFYLGWLVWAVPANLLLQKSPVGKFLGINIVLWGAFLMAQGGVRSFAALVALRTISGAVESIADPCFLVLIAMFYRNDEQPLRIAAFYFANGVGFSAGGLIGYGIGQIDAPIASWRLIFLLVGAACLLWGLVIIAFCPDHPATFVGLCRDDRLRAVARVRDNQSGIATRRFKPDQAREAVLDHRTFLYLAIAFVSNAPNGILSNFGTLIVRGLDFSTLNTTLLQIPYGAIVVFWIGSAVWLNQRLPGQTRLLLSAAYMLPTIAGALGLLFAPQSSQVGRLWCYYLTSSFQAPYVLYLSIITSSVGGHTKRILTISASFIGFTIGNIAGPFFMHDDEAPHYRSGIVGILVCNVLEATFFLLLRASLVRSNREKEEQLRRMRDDGIDVVVQRDQTAQMDVTDRQNPYFRYSY